MQPDAVPVPCLELAELCPALGRLPGNPSAPPPPSTISRLTNSANDCRPDAGRMQSLTSIPRWLR
jgi:hypothetical protein